MKVKAWFKNFLAGMGIGVGAAIPGVSGAAIAVICKVYEAIIWAINNIKKSFKKAFNILLPVLLGIILAVIPCIWLFDKALETFVFGTISVFAGFLIGSFPGVVDEVRGVKVHKKEVFLILGGIVFVCLLGVASVLFAEKIDVSGAMEKMPFWMYLVLIPVGIIAAVALTVPGLSGSLILLIIGFYKPLLHFTVTWCKEILTRGNFSNFGRLFGMIACFGCGVLLGVIIVSKIMKSLLAHHHDATYFAIVGFVFGSILVLFFNYEIYHYYLYWAEIITDTYHPLMDKKFEIPLGLILLTTCGIISYQLVRVSRKHKKEITNDLGMGN